MFKKSKITLLIIILLIFTNFNLHADINFKNGILTLENEKMVRRIQLPEQTPGPVFVSSIYSKQTNKELLAVTNADPYFEFVINNRLITANDNIWQYKKHEIRKMQNGGEEIKIFLQGRKSPVKDLTLIICQQLFANRTLIREQLVLQAPGKTHFTLNKLNNRLHFKFPQYSLINKTPVKTTEIRIATWANELIDFKQNAFDDYRKYDDKTGDLNLAHCHMFHPQINEFKPDSVITTKGPIQILSNSGFSWITAYEHASQDGRKGIAASGFDWEEKDDDFHFLGISQNNTGSRLDISVDILRGGYLDGETITPERPYESVWTVSAFCHDGDLAAAKAIIHDYLINLICEKPASRKPAFYYNTWGMQRDLEKKGNPVREVFTEERILQEIKNAAELGVDLFVLDDGWEQDQGDWTANKQRLKNGLAPVKAELDKYGIDMGIWLSTAGISKETDRYKQHPEWVIKDAKGEPFQAQWDQPAFDFVSGFYDLFIADCKKLIDQGVRFFKWDAINTFNSTLPNLYHGSDRYSALEIKQRYEYLLPLYITRAMKELTDYEPDLVIEIDVTEARRVLVGLAPLSQGKFFWMNNGASGYGDRSVYRAKSMRTIVNEFGGIIPLELFTFANYPHNSYPYFAQRYNVNTSLIAGHGFWGNLEDMNSEQRLRVGKLVAKSKRVLPYIVETMPEINGKIGSSPEIYTIVNQDKAAGQIIAFSGQAKKYEHKVTINSDNLLAVLNHAYNLGDDNLTLCFEFMMPDDAREAFLLTNNGDGISIVSSTSWLDDVLLNGSELKFTSGAPGIQTIQWNKKRGKPEVSSTGNINYKISDPTLKDYYLITVQINEPDCEVIIR
ncbi:alpha-galactosidase [candidate division KSB1 bacterium]|nr:alpha-galactosidase [candidate division KSB1 bacterium]